jgi:hypothetical protein
VIKRGVFSLRLFEGLKKFLVEIHERIVQIVCFRIIITNCFSKLVFEKGIFLGIIFRDIGTNNSEFFKSVSILIEHLHFLEGFVPYDLQFLDLGKNLDDVGLTLLINFPWGGGICILLVKHFFQVSSIELQ